VSRAKEITQELVALKRSYDQYEAQLQDIDMEIAELEEELWEIEENE